MGELLMTLVGPDGNDLPDILDDGVTAYDWVAINSRVYTEYQREAFDLDFGVGLVHALGRPLVPATEITRRLEASLVGDILTVRDIQVRRTGNTYGINVELEV